MWLRRAVAVAGLVLLFAARPTLGQEDEPGEPPGDGSGFGDVEPGPGGEPELEPAPLPGDEELHGSPGGEAPSFEGGGEDDDLPIEPAARPEAYPEGTQEVGGGELPPPTPVQRPTPGPATPEAPARPEPAL
jgi:hypothetical protein